MTGISGTVTLLIITRSVWKAIKITPSKAACGVTEWRKNPQKRKMIVLPHRAVKSLDVKKLTPPKWKKM
jgi:hypothetical protein